MEKACTAVAVGIQIHWKLEVFTVTLFKWQYSYLLISTELQRVGIGLIGLTIMFFQGEEIIIILFCFLFEPDYSVLLRATSDL